MKLVIDIDEKDLRLIELHQPCELTEEYLETIFMKIENGTPLEKVLEDIKAEPILDKIRAEIGKSKTEHELQLSENDTKGKLLISDIYCDIVNIIDKCKAESEE